MSWQSRRVSGPLAVSIAAHVLIAIGLARVLVAPFPFGRLFAHAPESLPAERISFLALPRSAARVEQVGRAGGNGRPVTKEKPAPIATPSVIPSSIPAPTSGPETPSAPGTGEIIGGGGATVGIRPSFSDPRLWVPAAPVVSAPKSASARLDSALLTRLKQVQDSLAVANGTEPKRAPGDWTITTKNGDKYGMDGQFIRLGKVSIPTPLLAMLPLNVHQQQNPVMAERNRALDMMRNEILTQAQRSMNEEEFRDAVRRLRERKERERRDRPEVAAGEH